MTYFKSAVGMILAATLFTGCGNGRAPTDDASGQPFALYEDSKLKPTVGGAKSGAAEKVSAREVLASRHFSLLALSREEAAWLDRHAYPTQEEMDALPTYDIEALESAMRDRRDAKAAALVGHRRLLDGNVDAAVFAFGRGAELGSLYARQQLAIAMAQSVTGLPVEDLWQADQGNIQVMVAQLEVAKMLGDHRAQAYIDQFTTNFDWRGYGQHVLTQTAEFMRQYGEGARARGERAMGPDPRPNADAWAQLESDPNGFVTVYERRPTSL